MPPADTYNFKTCAKCENCLSHNLKYHNFMGPCLQTSMKGNHVCCMVQVSVKTGSLLLTWIRPGLNKTEASHALRAVFWALSNSTRADTQAGKFYN